MLWPRGGSSSTVTRNSRAWRRARSRVGSVVAASGDASGRLAAGAMWVQTQPVYDLDVLDRFLARVGHLAVPVVVGILPLHSFRHAEFLHNEVPGITVPEEIRRRLREAGDHALRVGIETAQAILAEVRRRYAGAYLMPSFGRFEVVAEVLEAVR